MRRDYHIGQGHLELLSNFVSVLHNTGPLYMLTDQTAISVHAFIFHYLEVIFSLLSHNRDYRFCFQYSMFVYINTSLLYSLLTILFCISDFLGIIFLLPEIYPIEIPLVNVY